MQLAAIQNALRLGSGTHILLLLPEREFLIEMECRLESNGHRIYGAITWEEAQEVLCELKVDVIVACSGLAEASREAMQTWVRRHRAGPLVIFVKSPASRKGSRAGLTRSGDADKEDINSVVRNRLRVPVPAAPLVRPGEEAIRAARAAGRPLSLPPLPLAS